MNATRCEIQLPMCFNEKTKRSLRRECMMLWVIVPTINFISDFPSMTWEIRSSDESQGLRALTRSQESEFSFLSLPLLAVWLGKSEG